ncbi:hypothetical protein Poli38472_013310 [Pythium oligandrum]|uniref:Uncharacterized protein n=1 Tax=Pythium oligandrum TaxID=41045 RepID=A0A8K1C2S4_PYTOL|nr:hypothetical protein Poli38472_013310 [Pythium oligandrum]|eukprot:TMW55419.1 hypothetical protein Poli38472_013310 [Pythium oligandrum]
MPSAIPSTLTHMATHRERYTRPYTTVSPPMGFRPLSPKRGAMMRREEEYQLPHYYEQRGRYTEYRVRDEQPAWERPVTATYQERTFVRNNGDAARREDCLPSTRISMNTSSYRRPLSPVRRRYSNELVSVGPAEPYPPTEHYPPTELPSVLPRLSHVLKRSAEPESFEDGPYKKRSRVYEPDQVDERAFVKRVFVNKFYEQEPSRPYYRPSSRSPQHQPIMSKGYTTKYLSDPVSMRPYDARRSESPVESSVVISPEHAEAQYYSPTTKARILQSGYVLGKRTQFAVDPVALHEYEEVYARSVVTEHHYRTPAVVVESPSPRSNASYDDAKAFDAESAIEAATDLIEERSPSKRESITRLLLKSKEFLKAKSLVRNRNNEIDWVATFLNVGFESSSIYSLMCPLRKGRWKVEEEKYTMELLRLIENGTIRLRHGQSIRGFIAKKLHSDDMRVLKKLSNCKMFHFARSINPQMSQEEEIDETVPGTRASLDRLQKLKAEFLRSVQLEALVAVRKYLSDSSIRELLNGGD